jgi:pimeloyl-ACP methyl ester carboxylesterase
MKTLTRQALLFATLVIALECQSREPPAGGKPDDRDKNGESLPAQKGDGVNNHGTGHYATVNGLKLYYETFPASDRARDSGVPLILLHGAIHSVELFSPVLPELTRTRQVIGVDLQAHGRTADIDRPLRFELMADDIDALIKQLGIEKADILGYSLGGGVALRAAIQHPDVVRKLIVVSEPFKRDGWYPEFRAAMANLGPKEAEITKQSPLYEVYARIAPRPQDWPVLWKKLGELVARDYDWSMEVAAIKAPTLLVFGDADAVRTAHAVEFFELLGGGKKGADWDGSGMPVTKLAILPGFTHYDILTCPVLAPLVNTFVDAPVQRPGEPAKKNDGPGKE